LQEDFATKDKQYDSCKYGQRVAFIGQKCLEDSSCCDGINPSALGLAPNALLLTFGYFFPVSAISFVYAVTCVGDPGHLKVWKKMLGIKSNQTGPGQSTGHSGASTAASSVAPTR
jgi:hypothetical protein